MKNCDIIHIGKGDWYAPWSLFCMVSPNSKGTGVHSNYWVENVRFEEPTALFGLQTPDNIFQNVMLKNITMLGEPIPSYINCRTDKLTFNNLILNGKLVVSEKDIPIREGSLKIENAKYIYKE